ncbi:phosphotransferase [Streptomyces sp. LZ34]
MSAGEERLPGGFVTEVVRVGDTVRRRPTARTAYVRALLAHFADHGWPGAPRHLGTDERGREILSYLDGHVAWQPDQPPAIGDDESLAAMARLVREFHDLTAGTPLAEGGEVVCHNDLSPKNTVYRPRPVAFIDWDLAAPGRRVHDVAHACWQFCGTGPDGPGPDETARRMAVVCDAYGTAAPDRARLVATVLWWQDRCRRGIEAQAAAGDPAMARLRDLGASATVRAAHAWTTAHRHTLEHRLAAS